LTHAFAVEFASEEDRDYYVRHDPAHLAFVKSVEAVVEKAQVLDFTPGIF
jgi:Stress responsive A/B Barrel Domain